MTQFLKKPGAGVGPPAFGGDFGDAERTGGLGVVETGEIAQFYQFGLRRVMACEFFERLVNCEQLVIVGAGSRKFKVVDIQPRLIAAMPWGAALAGPVDQDASHRLGGGGAKVRAILPRRLRIAAEPQPGFMDEGRRLQRQAGGLARHFRGGKFAQLLVNERKELVGGLRVAILAAFGCDYELTLIHRADIA